MAAKTPRPKKLEQNIFLCGFMGCGKTTVGRLLARRLGMEFQDMDQYIEQQAGKPIPAIFAEQGEAAFRQLEHKAVLELSQRQGFVIPTGGGVLTRAENIAPLKQSGILVYINTPFSLCYQRICSTDRPLVQSRSREELYELYRTRRSIYRDTCDFEISGIGGSRSAVRKILERLAQLNETQGEPG